VRPDAPRWSIELPVHLVCSLGIVLGRITRLNSWDTVTTPRWTAERIFNTLTWEGAPLALVAIFVAVLVTTTVLRILWDAVWRWWQRLTRRDPSPPIGRIPI
jgi:uncharacterized membrane protein